MAKMLRWERAWKCFTEAFRGINSYRRANYSRKAWAREQANHEQQYWRLVKVAQELGVSVWKNKSLGTAVIANGEKVLVAGWFVQEKLRIDLVSRSYGVLAHEFAHAVDYLISGFRLSRSEQELIACAAGYLLTCQGLGICSPAFDVDYAKSQGATEITLKNLEGHILRVFQEMNSLLTT